MIYCSLTTGWVLFQVLICHVHRIPIHERVELPDELIPADSRVEIDAKITAGKSTKLDCGAWGMSVGG